MTRPAPTAADPGRRGRLPVPARDRRPALAALALLLVVAGALGSALVVYRSGQRTDVLVAARDLTPGQRVTSADFRTARVSTDADAVVRAADERAFVGSYVTTSVPAGTLVNRRMFQVAGVIPSNGAVVGVTLGADVRPARDLRPGDVVRAFFVPKSAQATGSGQAGQVIASAARVVDVGGGGGGSTGDAVTASLLVTEDVAPQLISAAAQGDVAIAVLPAGTKPDLDFQTGG